MLAVSKSLFDDLFSANRDLDKFFERSWQPLVSSTRSTFRPELECYQRDGSVVYRVALPGVDPQNLDLTVKAGQVTVKGERTAPNGVDDKTWLVREFHYGKFESSFALPELVDVDNVSATFKNGILEITAPIAKSSLPKKIEIRVSEDDAKKKELKASA